MRGAPGNRRPYRDRFSRGEKLSTDEERKLEALQQLQAKGRKGLILPDDWDRSTASTGTRSTGASSPVTSPPAPTIDTLGLGGVGPLGFPRRRW